MESQPLEPPSQEKVRPVQRFTVVLGDALAVVVHEAEVVLRVGVPRFREWSPFPQRRRGFGVIHVPEPAKALKEFRRVVRPGGRVAISTWQGPKPSNGFGLLFGAIKMHGNLDVPLPHGPDMFQFSEVEMMSAALEEVGLFGVEVIEAEQTWDFENSDGLLNGILQATVRGRGLLRAQTAEAFGTIREAVRSGMNQFKTSAGTYRVRMPAVIGVGQK